MKAVLEKYEKAPFMYGQLDCCLFVANVVEEMTGVDYAKQWRGSYSTEFGAMRLVASLGGLRGTGNAMFGECRPIWTVRKGDPVLLSPRSVEIDLVAGGMGVFDGKEVVCMVDTGFVKLPVLAGIGCWHV